MVSSPESPSKAIDGAEMLLEGDAALGEGRLHWEKVARTRRRPPVQEEGRQ